MTVARDTRVVMACSNKGYDQLESEINALLRQQPEETRLVDIKYSDNPSYASALLIFQDHPQRKG